MSGEVSDESAQSIGKKLGAQLIVSGSLSSMGHLYRFRIRALSVESAAVSAASATDIRTGDTRVAFLLSGARPVSVNVQQPSAPVVQPTPQPAPATVTPAAPVERPVSSPNSASVWPVKRFQTPAGIWWYLLEFKKSDARNAVADILWNKQAQYTQFKAQQALQMLDAQLAKNEKPMQVNN
jgi:hypothetical protein